MADFLQTGLSGLLSFQRALMTTSNNVANANTEGYSRQRVEFVTRRPEGTGAGFIGTGVEVSTVRRIIDQFSVNQYRTSGSSLGQLDIFNSFANQIDNVLGDPNTGLSSGLQGFFNAWQDISDDPASVPARQLLISQAESLTERFRTTDQRLNDLERDVNSRIRSGVTEINTLANSIAKINEDIVSASSGFQQPPNDLLDQRDALLNQLSGLIGITVRDDPDGSLNVFIGNGQGLILRSQVLPLGVQQNAFDPSRLEVTYQSSGVNQVLTDALQNGGSLGGALQVRAELIDPARNSLGQIATALATAVNTQHGDGMTLRGTLGGDFFSLNAPQSLGDANNTGTASVAVTVSNVAGLTPDDYFLRFDGTNYSLTRASNGQVVPMTGAGTGANPFVAEGLSIVVSGAAASGDRFMLRPTRLSAATLDVVVQDPRDIAAALPIRTSAATANTGNASVSGGQILDSANGALLNTTTIQFLTANTYSVNGAGSFAYTPGGNIDLNGWRIQIQGTPAVGDTFVVQSNVGGSGDNRNALSIAQLQTQGVLSGGNVSVSETFNALVGNIGTQARQASLNRDAQAAIVSQARESVLAASGVNLDEEAADMLRWQQAYQANAQVITVANSLFQTLMSMLR